MRDPYSILGVNKNADQREIKAAWRNTAKALHPDQNPDDPKAVGRFTEAGRAYDLLKDPEKRRLFDEARARASAASGRAGKEATFMEQRAERARAEAETKAAALARAAAEARAAAAAAAVDAENAGATSTKKPDNAEDVVSKIFGTRKSADTEESVEAPPPQAEPPRGAKAEEQSYTAYDRAPEKAAEPTQSHEPQPSPARDLVSYLLKRLTRQIPPPEKAPDLGIDTMLSIEDILNRVNPTVSLPDGKLLSIPLPDALQEGTQIRVEGYGHRLPGLKRGDVVATLRIKPHKWYRVDGHDIRTYVDVDIDKAVLGGEVTVDTPDGSQRITIPPWSGSTYSARLANLGLPKGAGRRGDLIAEVRVLLWDRPDPKLVDLMRSLRDGLYL